MIKLARDTLPKALQAGAGGRLQGHGDQDHRGWCSSPARRWSDPDGTKAKPVDKHAPPPPPNRAKLPAAEPDKKAALA